MPHESDVGLRRALVQVVRLDGSGLSGPTLLRSIRLMLIGLIVGTNVIGLLAVVAIAMFVVPMPSVPNEGQVRLVNGLIAIGYFLAVAPPAVVIGVRGFAEARDWLLEGRPPTGGEQSAVLRTPLRLFVLQAALWLLAAVLFGVFNLLYSWQIAARASIIVTIVGLSTASFAYLATERVLRPVAARALRSGIPRGVSVPGVGTRAVLAWAVGSGLSLLGLMAIGILVLTGDLATRTELAIAMVTLAGTGLTVGVLMVTLAARATADPIGSVRHALANVRRGEFGVHVPVYDGSQIGQLQHGFNQMVGGLAERERIREAFGVYVDPDVAARILERGTDLEGEEVEVTIMFIDIRDFTAFAERTEAREVVAAINRLFDGIVPIIHTHGGRVDKFIGDGLLAVFGAPRRQPDHADQALAAALAIDAATNGRGNPELPIGIGLNSGTVVSGNVGGAGRFEFSVIGDAVNTAARVESATRQTGDTILLTEHTRHLLRAPHPELTERPPMPLKGKTDPIRLCTPTAQPAVGPRLGP